MRHSQGDHWDLMVIFPVGSYAEYYQRHIAKRQQSQQAAKLNGKVGRRYVAGEILASGPPLPDLRKAFADGAWFHEWKCLSGTAGQVCRPVQRARDGKMPIRKH